MEQYTLHAIKVIEYYSALYSGGSLRLINVDPKAKNDTKYEH